MLRNKAEGVGQWADGSRGVGNYIEDGCRSPCASTWRGSIESTRSVCSKEHSARADHLSTFFACCLLHGWSFSIRHPVLRKTSIRSGQLPTSRVIGRSMYCWVHLPSLRYDGSSPALPGWCGCATPSGFMHFFTPPCIRRPICCCFQGTTYWQH